MPREVDEAEVRAVEFEDARHAVRKEDVGRSHAGPRARRVLGDAVRRLAARRVVDDNGRVPVAIVDPVAFLRVDPVRAIDHVFEVGSRLGSGLILRVDDIVAYCGRVLEQREEEAHAFLDALDVGLRHGPALMVVRRKQMLLSIASQDRRQLPCQVKRIGNARVQAIASDRRELMR